MGTRAFDAYVAMACTGQMRTDGDDVDESLFRELAAALKALGDDDAGAPALSSVEASDQEG